MHSIVSRRLMASNNVLSSRQAIHLRASATSLFSSQATSSGGQPQTEAVALERKSDLVDDLQSMVSVPSLRYTRLIQALCM